VERAAMAAAIACLEPAKDWMAALVSSAMISEASRTMRAGFLPLPLGSVFLAATADFFLASFLSEANFNLADHKTAPARGLPCLSTRGTSGALGAWTMRPGSAIR